MPSEKCNLKYIYYKLHTSLLSLFTTFINICTIVMIYSATVLYDYFSVNCELFNKIIYYLLNITRSGCFLLPGNKI